MKKPRLKIYLTKACVIAFFISIIAFIIEICVLDAINKNMRTFLLSNYESDIAGMINNQLFVSDPEEVVREGLKSDKYGQGLANIDHTIKMTSAGGCFAALYDSKGEKISDASEAVFFKIYKKNENGTNQIIWLESDYNKTWNEIFERYHNIYDEVIGENEIGIPEDTTFDEIMEYSTYNSGYFGVDDIQIDVQIIPEEIYFKGGYFVPGKTHVRANIVVLKDDNFVGYQKDVFDADLTPDNVSEFNKLVLGDDKTNYYYDGGTSPCVLGVSKDSKDYGDFEYFVEHLKKQKIDIFKTLETDYSNGGGYETFYVDSIFMYHLVAMIDSININHNDEDYEYALLTVGSSNVLSAYDDPLESCYGKGRYNIFLKHWLPIGMLTTLIMMIVASVIGGFVYLKKKSAYDLYTYRITTTNAMAHDLKTPLTAISGYAENLIEQVHVDKREYYAKSILTNVEYMDQMIHDILELSKSEDIRQKINAENISLAEIVREEIDSLSRIIEERKLSVSVSGDCELCTDRNMLTSLVDNLISNAVRYAKEQSDITINLADRRTSDALFAGNGILIKNALSNPLQKTVDELKKPYVKGDDSRGARSGSGVGLAIVENVSKKLGCKVVYDVTDEEFMVKVTF